MRPIYLFALIVVISASCLYIALPSSFNLDLTPYGIELKQSFNKRAFDARTLHPRLYFNPNIKLGLDLQGGTHLILQANMDQIATQDRMQALESAREIINRRIDLFGVSEPVIQTSVNESTQQYRLIIELPGVTDSSQAVQLIGQTAQLAFMEQDESKLTPEATMSAIAFFDSFKPTGLAGKDLKRASVQFGQQGEPNILLEFKDEGKELFKTVTERNVGKPVGIFIDGYPVTLPTVSTPITDGQAVISGTFTMDEANSLSIQLNAGALPVPIEIVGQNSIGATLGKISVQQSLQAGVIGLVLVMVFMILTYGTLGVLADLALIIYGLITIAIYKILGITLTLPGLAGLVLSIGMAVDANILIFERFKEEMRSGKMWKTAIEMAFGRAWDSIKDANITTLTVCFILFNPLNWSFLNTSGQVRGFALTLALGITTSLFTGIIVTRTLIRLFYYKKPIDITPKTRSTYD